MSFRDQTYLVILNWLCSVDFVSHLGTASCVSGSFNYRPLRGKEKKKDRNPTNLSDFPVSIFLCEVSSTHRMVQCCRLVLPCPPLPSRLPPATCFHSPSHQKHGQNECWSHQMGSGSRNRVDRWGGRGGETSLCGTGEVLCWVTPSEPSPVMLNDLWLNSCLLSLSPPMNESLLYTVMEKFSPQRTDTRRREVATGPWEHQLPRMHSSTTGAARRWKYRPKENAEMSMRKGKTQEGRMS